MINFNPLKILAGKISSRFKAPPAFRFNDLVAGKTWACTDLGAYQKPLQSLAGLTGVVIMEDRFPDFFLSYARFEPERETKLNRHGPLKDYSTQRDLKALVGLLQAQGIKAVIGFWNYFGWQFEFFRRPKWLKNHPEVKPIPRSSDIDPFFTLREENLSYAEYIAKQFQKLEADFGFDGLFLGDGFAGYRSIADPDLYRDKMESAQKWQSFYEKISRAVHQSGGLLFAYDCLGFPYEEAKLHGADYKLFSQAGLDYLVFQSYPQAWGEYWFSRRQEKFSLAASRKNLESVSRALKDTATQILYTVELNDRIEGWQADRQKTQFQIETLDRLASGRFLVWANDLLAGL